MDARDELREKGKKGESSFHVRCRTTPAWVRFEPPRVVPVAAQIPTGEASIRRGRLATVVGGGRNSAAKSQGQSSESKGARG